MRRNAMFQEAARVEEDNTATKTPAKASAKKKFFRIKEGAEEYSMSPTAFARLAREANATYKINKLVLVNREILEEYLEFYREVY